ncbi:MAG: hypothetical protein HRT87_00520, partial [Legionellales bacterium]|nr:hypothetical protein [Legionellales bacterium]
NNLLGDYNKNIIGEYKHKKHLANEIAFDFANQPSTNLKWYLDTNLKEPTPIKFDEAEKQFEGIAEKTEKILCK